MRTAHLSNTAKRMEPSVLTTVCFSSSSTNCKQQQQQKQQKHQHRALHVPQVGGSCRIVWLQVCNACACRKQGQGAAQLKYCCNSCNSASSQTHGTCTVANALHAAAAATGTVCLLLHTHLLCCVGVVCCILGREVHGPLNAVLGHKHHQPVLLHLQQTQQTSQSHTHHQQPVKVTSAMSAVSLPTHQD
jgi:hypothetical protein